MMLFALATVALCYLAWELGVRNLFLSPDVRKLQQAKKSLRAQLRYKKEVLRLRREIDKVQSQIDVQDTQQMRLLEKQIAALGLGAEEGEPGTESAADGVAGEDGTAPEPELDRE